MKILKYILFLIIALVVIAVAMALMQPSEYDVSRSKVVKAPADIAYNYVLDYKTWEKWGPWMEEDPDMKITYDEVSSGVGASYSWDGEKAGIGSMKTLFATENKSIDQEITFEGTPPSNVYWKFDEADGGTNVTWGMKGEAGFMFRMFAAFSGGFDGMIGDMYAKGLDKLDEKLAEHMGTLPKKKDLSAYKGVYKEATKMQLPAQDFIGYHHKAPMDHEKMTALYMISMPKAGMYANQQKLAPTDYIPSAVFMNWDTENNQIEMFIGMLVSHKVAPAEGMGNVELTEGDYVAISKFGNYGDGDEAAHGVIDQFMKDNNLEQNGPVLELYTNDPGQVKPEEVQTNIFYPVKAKVAE